MGNAKAVGHARIHREGVLGGGVAVRSADLLAKNRPRHVGAEFFAPNSPGGGALDLWAALGRNLAIASKPLAHCGLLHPKGGGQSRLTAEELDRAIDCFHPWIIGNADA